MRRHACFALPKLYLRTNLKKSKLEPSFDPPPTETKEWTYTWQTGAKGNECQSSNAVFQADCASQVRSYVSDQRRHDTNAYDTGDKARIAAPNA